MKTRKIQVGDDLSGKTLFINIPNTGSFLDSTLPSFDVAAGGTNILTTNNDGVIIYTKGAGTTDPVWEELSVRNNDFEKIIYSQRSWAVNINLSKIILPNNFGIVTSLENTPILNYIKIPEPISNIFIGEQPVKWIYKGDNLISNIIAGSHYTQLKEFNLVHMGIFSFEPGQTWRDWINQAKYWDSSLDFQIHEGDYTYISVIDFNGHIATLTTESTNVLPEDLIIEGANYRTALACLTSNTLIKTLNGNVPIATLKVGDEICKGNIITKVNKHMRFGYIRLSFKDGSVINATNDHKFIVKGKVKTAYDLLIGDLDLISKEYIPCKNDMYEIKTTTNKYELFNGIICECENI